MRAARFGLPVALAPWRSRALSLAGLADARPLPVYPTGSTFGNTVQLDLGGPGGTLGGTPPPITPVDPPPVPCTTVVTVLPPPPPPPPDPPSQGSDNNGQGAGSSGGGCCGSGC